MPLIGTPSIFKGGGRPASAASGALSLVRNSSSPAALVPASAGITCPRKLRADIAGVEECDSSEALVWNACRLDEYAARPGAADVPSARSSLATLAPLAESTVAVMSARPVRQPPAPPSKRALRLRAAPLASPSAVQIGRRSGANAECHRSRKAKGAIACSRDVSRPECGRHAKQLNKGCNGGRGIGHDHPAQDTLRPRC